MDLNDHVEKFLGSRSFIYFMLELHQDSLHWVDAFDRIEEGLRTLPELAGELSHPEASLDDFDRVDKAVDEDGALYLSFPVSEGSFLINEVFGYVLGAHDWFFRWSWDEPGQLDHTDEIESDHALRDLISEARDFYQFAKELHNGICRELTTRNLAPHIEALKNEPSVRVD